MRECKVRESRSSNLVSFEESFGSIGRGGKWQDGCRSGRRNWFELMGGKRYSLSERGIEVARERSKGG